MMNIWDIIQTWQFVILWKKFKNPNRYTTQVLDLSILECLQLRRIDPNSICLKTKYESANFSINNTTGRSRKKWSPIECVKSDRNQGHFWSSLIQLRRSSLSLVMFLSNRNNFSSIPYTSSFFTNHETISGN